MSGASADAPPHGFKLARNRGPFSDHNGPYYVEGDKGEGARQAFFAEPRHTNGYGIVHGGMLTAFLDSVMSQAVRRATQRSGVTVQLSVSYLSAARPGEWVIGAAKVVRASRDLAFLEGVVSVGDKDVVRATAVFKLTGEA